MASISSSRRAYLRGAAQAFDLNGVIGANRLRGIRNRSVQQALTSDWSTVLRRLDGCVGRWVRRGSDGR